MSVFGTLVGGAAVWLVLGGLGRALTRSGRRITYITPISLDTEVLLNVAVLVLSALVLLASSAGLVAVAAAGSGTAGVVVSLLVGVALTFPAVRAGRNLLASDLAWSRRRRRERHPDEFSAR